MAENFLYYGDNLDILRKNYIKDESVDLIYLDPPFKSNQDYNVLFAEKNGANSKAQIMAFEDTWQWDQGAAEAYHEIVENGPEKVSQAMQAFRMFLGENDMLAYLSMMAPRLVELRRVLKSTGSIYLHCDPTASHYLKMLMDAVFSPVSFNNEITWKRTSAHNDPGRWGRVHDVIFFYTKTNLHIWNSICQSYDESYLSVKYRNEDARGKYRLGDLTGAGATKDGESSKPWRGYNPTLQGRHWATPKKVLEGILGKEKVANLTTHQKLELLDEHGYIYWTPRGKGGQAGFPQYKRYLTGGVPIQDCVTDIPPINSQAKERLGYPTQKPEALLERIIKASSNEGDLVLDPFCGCGTTINVAQRLNRNWIGIDITHLAITLIKNRLQDAFEGKAVYKVIGEPVELQDAKQLAEDDKYQFQWWALGLVGARPIEEKKGADKGIDGRIYFHDEPEGGKTKQIILSVKGGHVTASQVRDLRGVVEREGASIGVFITLETPTQPMRKEAASAGFYESAHWNTKHPKLQILTIEELLQGKKIDYPAPASTSTTFKKAPKAKGKAHEQESWL